QDEDDPRVDRKAVDGVVEKRPYMKLLYQTFRRRRLQCVGTRQLIELPQMAPSSASGISGDPPRRREEEGSLATDLECIELRREDEEDLLYRILAVGIGEAEASQVARDMQFVRFGERAEAV